MDVWLAKNGKNAICSNCGSTEVLVHDYLHMQPAEADGAHQEAYGEIAAGYPKPTTNSAKPPVQRNERPLQRH